MAPFSRINPILTQITLPVFSRLRDDDAKLLAVYRKGLRLLMAINAPLLIGLMAVAPMLVPALLGPGWEESVYVVQILSLYVLLRSAGNINVGLILAKGKFRWPLYINLVMLILIPATVFITAIVLESLIAISWALVALQFILFVMSYILFARKLLGKFGFDYISDFGRPALSAAIMGLSIILLQRTFIFSPQLAYLIVIILVGMVLYLAISSILQRQHAAELIGLIKAKM